MSEYPPHAALAMARAQKRIAEKYDDPELAEHAADLERRALEAIESGDPFMSQACRTEPPGGLGSH